MTGPLTLTDNQTNPGVFELGWLRRTHALADPVVRARGLCSEIASATSTDRVSCLLVIDRNATLVATSTTEAVDQRSSEAAKLRRIAECFFPPAPETSGDILTFDRDAESDTALETIAFSVRIENDIKQVAAVFVLQRYAPQTTSMSESLTAILDDARRAASEVAAAFREVSFTPNTSVAACWRRVSRGQRWVVAAMIGIAGIALLNIPVPFHLPVAGRLEPARTLGIYAPASGTLTRLHAVDAMDVVAGTLLAEINNNEIVLQQQRIAGELASAATELATLRLGAAEDPERRDPSSVIDRRARQVVLRARLESFKQQMALIDEVQQSLSIQAPMDGRVMLRDDQADLVGQSIGQSQWLMQLVDPTSGYRAVLELPEKDFGYLHDAIRDHESMVHGSLRLRSSPDTHFGGTVTHVADTVQWNQSGHPVVEVTMSISDNLPATSQIGATVVGTIDVGRRSLGFVWFRPLIEFIRSYGW